MESLFKDLLFSSAKQGNKKVSSWIESCIYNSMPFIRLKSKSRRRGKRIIYRVTYLTREEAEKKALISFSKHMNSQNSNAKRFSIRLGEELKSLATNKAHPVRVARDNIHKLALKHAPKHWFFTKKSRKENINKRKKIIKPSKLEVA